VRYALEKSFIHSCRSSFMLGIVDHPAKIQERDVVSNINYFMNMPMTPAGRLTFEDGMFSPGDYIEMRAEMAVIVLISNCPQLNNPCSGYNPTPLRYLIWESSSCRAAAA